MRLSKLEREVITDSMLKVESIQSSLEQIDGSKFPDSEEIHNCLRTAGKSLRAALRADSSSHGGN